MIVVHFFFCTCLPLFNRLWGLVVVAVTVLVVVVVVVVVVLLLLH